MDTKMNTETFLRKWFGLNGEFYTQEWKEWFKKGDNTAPFDSEILTDEANECWGNALKLLQDLMKMGAFGDDIYINIAHTLCDNS